MELSQVRAKALDFYHKLETLKSTLAVDFPWYPYYTLGNVEHLDDQLKGDSRAVFSQILGGRVLDIGAADGEWAFFLESLGCKVTAVDYPLTNANLMQGIRTLKQAMGSNIDIQEADIDFDFIVPEGEFDAVFFLGILYHLKNPFYALEKLSKRVKYCFLSTRIATVSPKGLPLSGEPLAYLLGADELNTDPSNYWIFSEPALRRLLERAGWQVCSFDTIGFGEGSDPDSIERDQRAFCLLRSLHQFSNVDLLEGWHPGDGESWRWTERQFSLRIPMELDKAARIAIDFFFPQVIFDHAGAVTLESEMDGIAFEPMLFEAPGNRTYLRALPADTRGRVIQFTLSGCLPPAGEDLRELGIVVSTVRLHK